MTRASRYPRLEKFLGEWLAGFAGIKNERAWIATGRLLAHRLEERGALDEVRSEGWREGHKTCVCDRPGATPCKNPYE